MKIPMGIAMAIGPVLGPMLGLAVGEAAAQPVAAGPRPSGALEGKIVFLHAGHGWTADNLGSGFWFTQRPETNEIVEDLHNIDFQTFQAEALWNAGATIAPLRPIGHQPNEVVLDNDDPEVTFVGAWSDSLSPIYFGDPGDTPYRFAGTSPTETAFARYRPTIPEQGFYPVYAWTRHGVDRVEQLYRVHHTGGATEITIDHTKVGNGLVYLGTYHFNAGTDGYVDVSNESLQVGVVIADMIRFGNGMGDIDRGAGVSGFPREDEAGLYWIETHAGRGIPSSEWRSSSADDTATVTAPTRWAEQMNREASGLATDRVFLSHHSNAFDTTARGVIALLNGNNNPATATPNQFLLAGTLAREINNDMVALDGAFEHDWADRVTLTLDASTFEYGEINNQFINNEFDATIVERAFHDNPLDAQLMRDARVCEALARSTTQGLIKYFNAVDGSTPPVFAPDRPTNLRAINNADGTITLNWDAPATGPGLGGGASGYRVYASTNGLGFDAGTAVNALFGSMFTFTGLDPAQGPWYFRVTATNQGGESRPSSVVAATPGSSASSVLIVDGFDRVDRFLNVRESYLGGQIDRVRERLQNSRDYVIQHASAIADADASIAFDSASNDAIIGGSVALDAYVTVVWILGEESSNNATLDAIEQSLVEDHLADGGSLFVSGAEIGWDMDALGNAIGFYNNTLRADFVADDALTYSAAGVPGSAFDGLSVDFDDGNVVYDANFCDVIAPSNGSSLAMTYLGGLGGGAAVQFAGGANDGRLIMLGFPFETILTTGDRAGIMGAALAYLDPAPVCVADVTTESTSNGVPDGLVTLSDFSYYLSLWATGDSAADITTTGVCDPGNAGDGVDLSDFSCYLTEWSAGCP